LTFLTFGNGRGGMGPLKLRFPAGAGNRPEAVLAAVGGRGLISRKNGEKR